MLSEIKDKVHSLEMKQADKTEEFPADLRGRLLLGVISSVAQIDALLKQQKGQAPQNHPPHHPHHPPHYEGQWVLKIFVHHFIGCK